MPESQEAAKNLLAAIETMMLLGPTSPQEDVDVLTFLLGEAIQKYESYRGAGLEYIREILMKNVMEAYLISQGEEGEARQ